jgi:hypothetical protein
MWYQTSVATQLFFRYGLAVEVIDVDVACNQFCVNSVQFVLGSIVLLRVKERPISKQPEVISRHFGEQRCVDSAPPLCFIFDFGIGFTPENVARVACVSEEKHAAINSQLLHRQIAESTCLP